MIEEVFFFVGIFVLVKIKKDQLSPLVSYVHLFGFFFKVGSVVGGSSQLVSVVRITPIYKPFKPFGKGITPVRGLTITMAINHLHLHPMG